MLNFVIDDSKCIRCGQCVIDCPMHIIGMEDLPYIKEGKEEECIKCQHCLAVCPSNALSIFGKSPESSIRIHNAFPKTAELEVLSKGRRSVRKYKNENVEKALIEELVEIALHAPTGVNAMQTNFFIVDDRETMHSIRLDVYKGIAEAVKNNSLPEEYEYYRDFLEAWEKNGYDNIFRSAPHMIVATADSGIAHTPVEDCVIALSYFELLAASAGLGAVWCGLGKYAIEKILPGMKSKLGIPENHTIGYIMMFGKPAIKYYRTVQKDTAGNIHSVKYS